MWWAIFFIISLSDGHNGFLLHRLPFYSEYECKAALAQLAIEAREGHVLKEGCIQFPFTSDEL